jgi:type IV secretory pathway VirB9-like protein
MWKQRQTCTEEKCHVNESQREWSDESVNQGSWKTNRQAPKPRQKHGKNSPSSNSERTNDTQYIKEGEKINIKMKRIQEGQNLILLFGE